VSFEVDYSGQKVIKSECRVQAETATCLTMDQNGFAAQEVEPTVPSFVLVTSSAHGFEMTGSVGYLCCLTAVRVACYKAGASDEADYPDKFRKCFVTHN
ncbi:RP1, partial [Symbiodinium necroappetens]